MPNSSQSSGLRSADAAIMAQPGKLTSLMVCADGTNAATVVLYDNASQYEMSQRATSHKAAAEPTAVEIGSDNVSKDCRSVL